MIVCSLATCTKYDVIVFLEYLELHLYAVFTVESGGVCIYCFTCEEFEVVLLFLPPKVVLEFFLWTEFLFEWTFEHRVWNVVAETACLILLVTLEVILALVAQTYPVLVDPELPEFGVDHLQACIVSLLPLDEQVRRSVVHLVTLGHVYFCSQILCLFEIIHGMVILSFHCKFIQIYANYVVTVFRAWCWWAVCTVFRGENGRVLQFGFKTLRVAVPVLAEELGAS